MANEEHLAILKQGVEVWNRWRGENPDIRPNLNKTCFRGTGLYILGEADFPVVYRSAVDFRRMDLSRVDLSEVRLSKANLSGVRLHGVDLSVAHLRSTDLSGADLSEANLSKADLSEANLSKANLGWAALREANLSKAILIGATLSGANLYRARLACAEICAATLSGTDLSEADRSGADFRWADLSGADRSGADLYEAILAGVDLRGANLSAADFTQAKVGWTIFDNSDLTVATGLEKVSHGGPSTIGIDTVYKSNGNIPEAFLRGAGVPDTFIEFARSLARTEQPIEYYSCFISYSSDDEDLAQRLYNDLQAEGVRCWFAPEDMKIGDPILTRIDESIRMHEKLLLILSENSVNSTWVEREVQMALAKEEKSGPYVLFPIRVDDAVMEMEGGWPALVRSTRHIGDFTQWKDHDAYQAAFERLLRDLKAEW